MQIQVAKMSSWRIPRKFIESWLNDVACQLSKKTQHRISKKEITIAFVDVKHMTQLNSDFRSKNRVTDILSFEGFEPGSLGELVLCGDIVDQQAMEHKLARNEELGYLLIHGVLHLLGYEHENGDDEAEEMFSLQDSIFDILRKRYF